MQSCQQGQQSTGVVKVWSRKLTPKIEEWKKDNPQSSFFFPPFHSTSQTEQTADIKTCSEQTVEETLLYIQQEDWQKELVTRYGNTVTLMDATYKTTKYSIPLFFVCVKTNVSYSVVAEFIIQSETAECIYEALSILKSWNPKWEPQFYITDYSDVEIAAVNKLFPKTQVYLCEFHREQAWERHTDGTMTLFQATFVSVPVKSFTAWREKAAWKTWLIWVWILQLYQSSTVYHNPFPVEMLQS